MGIQRINPDDIEVFSLTTNPPRTFSSSSSGVVSGTLNVFPRRSSIEKEVQPLSIFTGSFVDRDLDAVRKAVVENSSSNKFNQLSAYMQMVNSQAASLRKQQTVEILRFTPSVRFDSNTLRKSAVINNLMPYYRPVYPEAHFAFANYNSLNFITGAGMPSDTALIYADPGTDYELTGAFTFDFWINPRYTADLPNGDAEFKAGTIFHRSSSYAVSLITGSSKDINGYSDAYRLVLQLSNSAEVKPSLAVTGTSDPNRFTFISDDNALDRNTWHHVTIRWGTSAYNNGSGSFLVDGVEKGTFVIPSASLADNHNENVLMIGNFFEGQAVGYWFTTDVANRDGLDELVSDTGQYPSGYLLDHGLNAEVHDLKIYNRYLNNDEVDYLQTNGPSSGSALLHDGLRFYLPPFYTKESPRRSSYAGHGGVLATPFYTRNDTTSAPFNLDYSFTCGGHYLNLENFVRDFATSRYARLFNLTASAITGSATDPQSANDYLYVTGSNIKRNLMLLPNDNGNFLPDFTFMVPDTTDSYRRAYRRFVDPDFVITVTASYEKPYKVQTAQFLNDLGHENPGFVTLRDMLPEEAFQPGLTQESGSIVEGLNGASPDDLSALPSSHGRYTIVQRTGDRSSNQIVFFDISNLYYGMHIEPGSLVIRDSSVTGSNGKVSLTLKDDGEGNIFRADHSGSVPDWASVGNIFYNEGIIMLKHPSLYFFGKDQFEMSFRGNQNIHILTFNLFKRPLMFTSSSNPSYLPVSASEDANDTDKRFVYITSINLHDDNLNVISKTNLAQPVLARTAEKFLFKVRMDF